MMKAKTTVLLLAIFAMMFLVTACASSSSSTTVAPASNTQDGATLVQERCTVCHTLSRAESQHLSSAEWKSVVDMMMARGARLTADEETLVVDYLAATYGK
jgi:cytochrome c-type biogenesis protein CcmH/NrfF